MRSVKTVFLVDGFGFILFKDMIKDINSFWVFPKMDGYNGKPY